MRPLDSGGHDGYAVGVGPFGGVGLASGGCVGGIGADAGGSWGGTARFSSIAVAAQAQNLEAVADFLAQGANVDTQDADGNTALHWAAWFRQDALVHQLVERGARVDLGNASGETPVHWAAKATNVNGLDSMTRTDRSLLSVRDCGGYTPFIICAQNDNAPVMEWMYLKGISVEEQDDWGRTALHWACYKGHRRAVQWLLSRSASIVHRDHEGMTAIHWAALKGHEQVAEMLLDVGAAHLLHVADAAGDTPIALATRKKNRYLVICFHKCQLFLTLFGRPNISHNYFANLFVCFVAFNILVFAFIVAPGIAGNHPGAVFLWSGLMGAALVLWVQNCLADPGWIQAPPIFSQSDRIGDELGSVFDVSQPIESQMAQQEFCFTDGSDMDGSPSVSRSPGSNGVGRLEHLELEQNLCNYRRQLLTKAQKRLDEEGNALGEDGGLDFDFKSDVRGLVGADVARGAPKSPGQKQAQLRRAEKALRDRERATNDNIARARVERLLAEQCGEYLMLVERGEFKQVCVVCRARKRMRSHHCKECGRCVDRLDHHCPWIDNCVGLENQRSFYCFILMLLSTILYFYYVIVLYACEAVLPAMARGSIGDLFTAMYNGAIGPELRPLIVLASAAFNLIWISFVGALVARHTAYMLVNITTYEALVRPSHVTRRFPRSRGRFWYFEGCGLAECARNCYDYWTLSMEHDVALFSGLVARPMESAIAPEQSGAFIEPIPPVGVKWGVSHPGPSGENYGTPATCNGSPAYHLLSSHGGN